MTPAKSALKAVVDNAPAVIKNSLASTFGKGILIGEAPLMLAGAGFVEGATEYGQTLGGSCCTKSESVSEGFTVDELSEADVAGTLELQLSGSLLPSAAKDMPGGAANLLKKPTAEELAAYEKALREAKKRFN